MRKIGVVGAGVVGRTTALVLKKHFTGHEVDILAESLKPKTSRTAAAIWGPVHTGNNVEIGEWANEGLRVLRDHAFFHPDSGARLEQRKQINAAQLPWWKDHISPRLMQIEYKQNNKGLFDYTYETVVTDTRYYMPWLDKQCRLAGIQLIEKSVNSLAEILPSYDAIVVCTGGDKRLHPEDNLLTENWGTVLVYDGRLTDMSISAYSAGDLNFPSYIIPRGIGKRADTICGGTSLPFKDVSQKTIKKIQDGIDVIAPGLLRGLSPRRIAAAARPYRPTIRFDDTIIVGKLVMNNYGHGGSGYTLAWGCAKHVALKLKRHFELNCGIRLNTPGLTGSALIGPQLIP